MVEIRFINKHGGYVIFSENGIGDFYDVWMSLVKNREDVNRWVEHLSLKNWFTTDLRNKFTDICENHLSII